MAKRKNKINSIVAPLTPRGMRREINAETRQKFGELGRDLRGDLRASKQDIRNTNSWFAQYQNRMKPVIDQQQRATADLQDRMEGDASRLSAFNRNQSDATGAEQDRSAAIRGAVADPTARSRDAAADEQRQALMTSSRNQAGLLGGLSSNYLTGVTAASELGRQADVRGIRNSIAETRSKQRTLSREKGDFRITRASEKRGEERQWRNENRTFAAGRADARRANALDWATENRLGREANNSGGGSGGGKGGKGGRFEPGEVRSSVAQLRKQLSQGGVSPNDPKSIQKLKTSILDELMAPPNAVDPGLARVAYRRILNAAKRWDSNPNNVGSSAWNKRNQNR